MGFQERQRPTREEGVWVELVKIMKKRKETRQSNEKLGDIDQ